LAPAAAVARSKVHKATDSLAGRGMWIWYVSRSSGDTVSRIVTTTRRYGVSTLIVKSSDGPTMWSQFNPSLVSSIHASGFRVCAWQYVYGNHPLLEAQVGAQAVHDGADCLVIDAGRSGPARVPGSRSPRCIRRRRSSTRPSAPRFRPTVRSRPATRARAPG